tara:strand:+ start:655 stop:927 length:273 start_codon:yes stop_codon:yes gene_type:complete
MVRGVSARAEMSINVHAVNKGTNMQEVVIMQAHSVSAAIGIRAGRWRLMSNRALIHIIASMTTTISNTRGSIEGLKVNSFDGGKHTKGVR